MVGPRWRRSARLLEPSDGRRTRRRVRPRRPQRAAARTPLMPTRRMRDSNPALAETVMPEAPTHRLETDDGPDRPRRRFSPAMKAGVLVVALLFAAGRRPQRPRLGFRSLERRRGDRPDVDRYRHRPRPAGTARLVAAQAPARPRPAALTCDGGGAPRSRNGPVVVFGVARGRRASNSALLPATFLGSTGQSTGAVPRRSAVRLPDQNLEAWRYPGLRPIGNNRQLTVFTVPTSSGVATVACALPPAAAAAFAAQCDAIAGTLQLRSGRAYPIGASDALRQLPQRDDRRPSADNQVRGGDAARLADAGWSSGGRAGDCQRLRGCRQPACRARPEPSRQGGKCAVGQGAPSRSQRVPPRRERRHCGRPGRVSRRECRGPGRQAGGELRPRGRARPPATSRAAARTSREARPPRRRASTPSSSEPKSDAGVGDSRSDDPSDDEEEN